MENGKQEAADLIQSKVKCQCVLKDRGRPLKTDLKCISILEIWLQREYIYLYLYIIYR